MDLVAKAIGVRVVKVVVVCRNVYEKLVFRWSMGMMFHLCEDIIHIEFIAGVVQRAHSWNYDEL